MARTNYMYRYLVGRVADPLIGVTIGVAAYFVHERRVGRAEGHTLVEMVRERWTRA